MRLLNGTIIPKYNEKAVKIDDCLNVLDQQSQELFDTLMEIQDNLAENFKV